MQTRQLRLQTDLARAANIQALVSLSSPFNIDLVRDPQMAKLWVEGAEELESYTSAKSCRSLKMNRHHNWAKGKTSDMREAMSQTGYTTDWQVARWPI